MDSEDTEWNDILREKGIIPPKKELEVTEEQIEELLDEVIRKKTEGKDLSEMNIDELNALLDDSNEDLLEDDRIVQQYRQQRIKEMQDYVVTAKFGTVLPLQKAEYSREVNDASKDCYVVVYLYQDHIPICKLLLQYLDILAKKYPHTKFMKIRADLCIENYPDKNCPTLIIYGKGQLVRHLAGNLAGTEDSTVETLEAMLKAMGALGKPSPTYYDSSKSKNDEDEDFEEEDDKDLFGNSRHQKGIRKGQSAFTRVDKKYGGDDSDDWD